MVQTYLRTKDYSSLEVMISAVKICGYTIPQDYLDALDKAKKAVQREKKVIP